MSTEPTTQKKKVKTPLTKEVLEKIERATVLVKDPSNGIKEKLLQHSEAR